MGGFFVCYVNLLTYHVVQFDFITFGLSKKMAMQAYSWYAYKVCYAKLVVKKNSQMWHLKYQNELFTSR